ncbi:GTP-binding protein yptV1, putative [Entamoeba dispar SAW760]|uniref:GTP-binding protein yptV1, putative n=1 Tax=Entamoeba dispar (strain ATCC PRA-260 / SAW760) TaxID=370354 RepID=B0E5T7_ENTDS|nr:GTP-binding protein yptV1, putative [Entamoeba dispar SAW760]EDR30123.1 GTP-binding protein yptV1, putative [Entamoeba dispar SAW760]|eukprot:EDR30123.1 GTP-binding protein yptV1, putative [Entamoeba dispar SAW760]
MTDDEVIYFDEMASTTSEESRGQNVKIIFLGDDLEGVDELIKNGLARLLIKEKIDEENYRIQHKGEEIMLTISYTDGKEKTKSLTTMFFKSANIVFIVYQIGHPETAEHLNAWSKEVDRYAENSIPRKLLGLKSNKTPLEVTHAKQFAEENLVKNEVLDINDPTLCSQLFIKEIDNALIESIQSKPLPPKKNEKKSCCCLIM